MTLVSFVKTMEMYDVCRWIIRGLPIGHHLGITLPCVAVIAGCFSAVKIKINGYISEFSPIFFQREAFIEVQY